MNLNLPRTLQSLKIGSLLGGILGLGFGCVITLEPLEPCDSGSNNKLDDNGECECRIGYEWCDPNDAENLNCCDSDIGDDSGTTTNTTNTGDGDGDTGDGDGDTGDGDGDPGDGDGDGDGDCADVELPPETCLPEEENFSWCTNSDDLHPECGQFFVCQGGFWTENPSAGDESCMFDGYDFSYGCVDNGMEVVFDCGDGSGAACNEADPAFCLDDDQIAFCLHGKETADSCLAFCQEEGIEGQTYEYGECDDSIPDDIACFCCDSGDEGCPI
jgi:hypothetical protein